MQTQLSDQNTQLREAHASSISEIGTAHALAITQVTTDHAAVVTQLRAELKQMETLCNKAKSKGTALRRRSVAALSAALGDDESDD
jgi:alanine-alpha-ketoisovalerate/valine-pyruvate aminotransferase